MSSEALVEGPNGVQAAWETQGQVKFARVEPATVKLSPPVAAPGAGKGRKHPVLAVNARGETLFAWTEGTGWNRGGSLAWQLYDRAGQPASEKGRVDGGIAAAIGRFDRLADAAGRLGARGPAICVFLKPRMTGALYVRESADRVVITWRLTEPFGSLLDFSWFPTANLFQAVLHRDGSIEMSYKTMSAKDGIVGIYPALSAGESGRSADLSQVTESCPKILGGTGDATISYSRQIGR